jgi:hypothetical protein
MKPSPENDARLLGLDFICECGDLLASFGAAIAAAAAAENREALELGLRHARGALIEAIAQFRALPDDGGANE